MGCLRNKWLALLALSCIEGSESASADESKGGAAESWDAGGIGKTQHREQAYLPAVPVMACWQK